MSMRSFIAAAIATFLFPAMVVGAPSGVLPASPAPAATADAPVTPLTRDLLLTSLSRDLAAHFDLDGDLELELIRDWAPPAQVAHAWKVEIREFPTVASSAMVVRCRVYADNNVAAETSLMVRATLWRDAWATRFPTTTGATFDPAVLETRRVDLLRDRDALPASVGDASYIFACAVPAGRLLTWRDIARRPLVKRGDMVDVSAVDGMLTITMKAVAMENGGRGDRVTVRNPDSHKDFSALVIDENRVQVRF